MSVLIDDAKFYQTILSNSLDDKSIEIFAITKTVACAKNANFLSNVFKIGAKGFKIVKNKKVRCQFDLIVKQILNEGPFMNVVGTAFVNERIGYEEIIVELNRYARKKIAVPRCFFCNSDLIVLEDLGKTGHRNVDRIKGYSEKQILKILKEIANLHAASIVLQNKNPDKFLTLTSKVNDFLYDDTIGKELLDAQKNTINFAINILKERNMEVLDKLSDLKLNYFAMYQSCIKRKRKLSVINHGDLWANNIMINGQNSVKLIDLQIMRCTSVAADLSYFMYINIHPDIRKQNEKRFLQAYLTELKECVAAFDVHLVMELNMEWLEQEMLEFAAFGYLYGMWLLPLFLKGFNIEKQVESISDLSEEHKERIFKLTMEYMYKM